MRPTPTSTSSYATTTRSSGCRSPRSHDMAPPRFFVKLALVMVAVVCSYGAPHEATVTAQTVTPRTVIVVSDLHMGGGRDRAGAWRSDEPFRWAADLGAFLD